MSSVNYIRWCKSGCGKTIYFRHKGVFAKRLYCDVCKKSWVKKKYLKR